MEIKSGLTLDQKEGEYCSHISPAREAVTSKRFAKSVLVNVNDLLKKLHDPEVERVMVENSSDGDISLFQLPGK